MENITSKHIHFKFDRGLKQKDFREMRKAIKKPLNLVEIREVYKHRDRFEGIFIKRMMDKGVLNPGEGADDLKGQFSIFFKAVIFGFDKKNCQRFLDKHEDKMTGVVAALRGWFYYRLDTSILEAHQGRSKKQGGIESIDREDFFNFSQESSSDNNIDLFETYSILGSLHLTRYVFLKYMMDFPKWFLDFEFDVSAVEEEIREKLS